VLEPNDIFPRDSDSAAALFYDPVVHLVANTIDNGVFHSAWMSAEYGVALIEGGAAAAIERGEAVIDAVLTCQDMDERSPHYGNFRWEYEDDAVEDLNAVQFVLVRLIPLMLQRSGRLSEALVARVKDRIRIALDAVRRIDVSPVYSNIVAQDIANSILGGELLGAPEYTLRGVKKLRAWLNLIDQSGIPHEYNSPTYSFVTIEALRKIVALSTHAEAGALAQLIIVRVGLSVALRIHAETGRLAPPHCRAYYPQLAFESPPESRAFSRLISAGALPSWLDLVLKHRPRPMMVSETSDALAGTVISSYLDKEFSLGVATQELATQSNRFISNQSNVFSIHYKRGKRATPGLVFSRYLINDKWLGDYRTTPSRANDHIFRDEGSFRGALAGPRAFGLYTSSELDAWSRCTSAKAVLIWNRADDVDEIWVDGARIGETPAEVPEGALIVVGCGDVYVIVRPLGRTQLGTEAPIRIVEQRGSLVIEMFNYRGPAKTFWELAKPGAFFQGVVRNGFFAEVVAKSRYASGRAAHDAFARSRISEALDEARTFDGENQRNWALSYSDGKHELGIEVDLMRWQVQRRWADGETLDFPMLASPIARQDRSGHIKIGAASLRCAQAPAWLLALPEAELWVGAYHGPVASALSLELPAGRIDVERLEAGIVVWDKGQVSVEALGLGADPSVSGARSVNVVSHGGAAIDHPG